MTPLSLIGSTFDKHRIINALDIIIIIIMYVCMGVHFNSRSILVIHLIIDAP